MKRITCAALALLPLTPASATVALNGNLNIVANSVIGDVVVSDAGTRGWSLVPQTLSASVSATNTYRDSILVTRGQALAQWASADAGAVQFQDFEWDLVSTDSMPPSHSDFSTNPDRPDWSYTFTASGNGKLVMDYDVSVGPGDPFGLWGWDIAFSGAGTGGPTAGNAVDPTAAGTFVGVLEDGQTYTVSLNTRGNVHYGSTIFGHDGAPMRGLFSWAVVYDAPEPGSLFVVAAGFGLLVRRSRKLPPGTPSR